MTVNLSSTKPSTATAVSNSLSFDYNNKASGNTLLVLHSACEDNASDCWIDSATWGGTALTPATSGMIGTVPPNVWSFSELWYLLNPDNGIKTLSVTYKNTAYRLYAGITTWERVVQQAPTFVSSQTKDPSSPYFISTQISSAANDLIVDVCNFGDNITHGIGANQTELFNEEETGGGNIEITASYFIPTGSKKYTMSHTAADGDPLRMCHSIATFEHEITSLISSQGCYISSLTTATTSSQVFGRSGTVWYYWDTDDKGVTRGSWTNSAKDGTVRYKDDEFKYQITDLTHNNTYYTRTYMSSNWLTNEYDWSPVEEFKTGTPATIIVSSNGAYESGSTSATISGDVYSGSGTAWFVWDTSDKGTTSLSDWSNTQKVTEMQEAGDGFTHPLTMHEDTIYYTRTYLSSNWWADNGDWSSEDWSNLETFQGTTKSPTSTGGDLLIYYNTLEYSSYIQCRCSRWDVNNYSVIVETWLKENDLNTLREYVTPGAVGELFTILGRPTYYDKTWTSGNTIKLKPNENNNLSKMRKETIVYVKNMTTSPIEGSDGWINVKIEGYVSGSGDL